jgi:cytochrome c oxidase cbb3-type subunit I/II
MWITGVTQGLMLSQTKEGGTVLAYSFIETVNAIIPLYALRSLGGFLFIVGMILCAYNVWKTARGAQPVDGTSEVFVEKVIRPMGMKRGFWNAPVLTCLGIIVFACSWAATSGIVAGLSLVAIAATIALGLLHKELNEQSWSDWHQALLGSSLPFSTLVLVAAVTGGVVQILPTVIVNRAHNLEGAIQIPYTPLELAGRDVYVREGCYNCHSQQIRTLVGDVLRYGPPSRLGESIYDHPYQWGSKRTGPDLAREGGFRPDDWHYRHMLDPRSTSGEDSRMPRYPWLFSNLTDVNALPRKIEVQRMLGVPMKEMNKEEVRTDVLAQATVITENLKKAGINSEPDREIIAVVAYLQKLGRSEEPGATKAHQQPPQITSIKP